MPVGLSAGSASKKPAVCMCMKICVVAEHTATPHVLKILFHGMHILNINCMSTRADTLRFEQIVPHACQNFVYRAYSTVIVTVRVGCHLRLKRLSCCVEYIYTSQR